MCGRGRSSHANSHDAFETLIFERDVVGCLVPSDEFRRALRYATFWDDC